MTQSFNNYDPNFNNTHDEYKFMKEYKNQFKVLVLMGSIGTGKTHLSKAWIEKAKQDRLNTLLSEQGYSENTYYEKFPGRINQRFPFIKSTEMYHGVLKYLYPGIEANKKACEFYDILKYGFCCVIDDLGNERIEKDKENFREGFIDLLESNVKLIITTNLLESQLLQRYGEKIFSRLKESYHKISFKGKDYRREG